MTGGQSASAPAAWHVNRWLTELASLVVGAALFALWFRLLSSMAQVPCGGSWCCTLAVAGRNSIRGIRDRPAMRLGSVEHGLGTHAPVAPLVVVGLYRYVRNPMYVGFAAGWIGLWIVFGHPSPIAIAIVVAVALGVHLFVVFYEEPTLRKKFGAEYEEY